METKKNPFHQRPWVIILSLIFIVGNLWQLFSDDVESDDEKPQFEENFLIGQCIVDQSRNVDACDEDSARQGPGYGGYYIFKENTREWYDFAPAFTPSGTPAPESWREDDKKRIDIVEYLLDTSSGAVVVRGVADNGCVSSARYVRSEDRSTVQAFALPLEGSCTEFQQLVNKSMITGNPTVWNLRKPK